ncbi:hypothetical protein [Yersinia hibernica]|nr:hypothetical protein [Yersinia hibernica]
MTMHRNYPHGWEYNYGADNSAKIFSADLAITPTLAGFTGMKGAITDDAQINGSVTLSLPLRFN